MPERIWIRNEWPNIVAWLLGIAAGSLVWCIWSAMHDDVFGEYLALAAGLLTTALVVRFWHVHITRRGARD